MRTQFETARAYQDYENLMLVASQIFGGEKSKPKPAETFEELENFINGL